MSAEPTAASIDSYDEGEVGCWCCDTSDVPRRMVQLGNHPEVHLCSPCAHYVHQQAWQIDDEGKRGPGAFVRDRFRNLRAAVMARGWHHHRFLGGTLRLLDQHVP